MRILRNSERTFISGCSVPLHTRSHVKQPQKHTKNQTKAQKSRACNMQQALRRRQERHTGRDTYTGCGTPIDLKLYSLKSFSLSFHSSLFVSLIMRLVNST